VSASTSGGNSAVAAAALLSAAPLALTLVVRVRVVRSRDISDFLFGADQVGRALSNWSQALGVRGRRKPRRLPFGFEWLPIICRGWRLLVRSRGSAFEGHCPFQCGRGRGGRLAFPAGRRRRC